MYPKTNTVLQENNKTMKSRKGNLGWKDGFRQLRMLAALFINNAYFSTEFVIMDYKIQIFYKARELQNYIHSTFIS